MMPGTPGIIFFGGLIMDGKLFFGLYLLYIVLLFIGYRFFVRYLERKKLKKKLEQEKKVNSEDVQTLFW